MADSFLDEVICNIFLQPKKNNPLLNYHFFALLFGQRQAHQDPPFRLLHDPCKDQSRSLTYR